MSSKRNRSSILKKQHTTPVAFSPNRETLVSASKGGRKIEFNRKKSIKEFLVGEDVDTIWGNSYEVSTDGTPSNGLEDATLGNSTYQSVPNDQNKENQLQIRTLVDDSVRRISNNTTNNSWDLSITIADDEKRRIRGDSTITFSQSFNTTDKLLLDPSSMAPPSLHAKLKPYDSIVEEGEVQAMDISPLKPTMVPSPSKSPRKMIYTFPKQAMFVEINDVPTEPLATGMDWVPVGDSIPSSVGCKVPLRPSCRNDTSSVTNHQPTLPLTSLHTLPNGTRSDVCSDPANESSDVDTTIALTNAMTRVLESCSNASIQKATDMDLDESTWTLPTNALARARPSFLPSNTHLVDESENTVNTPPKLKHDRLTALSNGLEETKSIDLSSPLEGYVPRRNFSLENLSILEDLKQPTKHAVESGINALKLDLGLSSPNLEVRTSSETEPATPRSRILRPLLPMMMLDSGKEKSEANKAEPKDEQDHHRTLKHGPRVPLTRQRHLNSEDANKLDEENGPNVPKGTGGVSEDGFAKKSHLPNDNRLKQSLNTGPDGKVQSRTMMDMEVSVSQDARYRATVFEPHDIINENAETQDSRRGHRATVVCNEKMELVDMKSDRVERLGHGRDARRSVYEYEPMLAEKTSTVAGLSATRSNHRGTILGAVPIEEAADELSHSPQAALERYRKSVHQAKAIKVDEAISKEHPDRKTIVCNDSIVVDVCAAPDTKFGSQSTITCFVQNVDELSIHAVNGNNMVDMKMGRPTTFHPQHCEESIRIEERYQTIADRQTIAHGEHMVLSEGAGNPKQTMVKGLDNGKRLTTHVVQAMEEDQEKTYEPAFRKNPTRKSIMKPEEMEQTLITEQCARETHCTNENPNRFTTHATEVMDDTIVEPQVCVRMENVRDAELGPTGRANEDLLKEKDQRSTNVRQQSRIPRRTTHRHEDVEGLQGEGRSGSHARYSCYNGENMDITAAESARVDTDENHERLLKSQPTTPWTDVGYNARVSNYNGIEMEAVEQEGMVESRKDQLKWRKSVYEREDINVTIDEDPQEYCGESQRDGKQRSSYYCDEFNNAGKAHSRVNQANLTTMDMEETRYGRQKEAQTDKPRKSSYQTVAMDKTNVPVDGEFSPLPNDGSNYKSYKADYEITHRESHGELAEKTASGPGVISQVVRYRPSTYQVEAMDETIAIEQQTRQSKINADELRKLQRSRQSIYHPEEMETTLVDRTEAKKNRDGFGMRKSILAKIGSQTPNDGMEGIRPLMDDSEDFRKIPEAQKGQVGPEIANSKRGTIFFTNQGMEEVGKMVPRVPASVESKTNRLTVYNAVPMVEEAIIGHKSAQGTSQVRRTMSSASTEKTTTPEAIRMLRNVKSRMESLSGMVTVAPVVFPAEHPPFIVDQLPRIRSGDEETMEMTCYTKTVQVVRANPQKNRQTIIQTSSMDTTQVGGGTVTPSSAASRLTINSCRSMEATPENCDVLQQKTVASIPPEGFSNVTPSSDEAQPIGRPFGRHRQTILTPLDMEMEDGHEGDDEHSFSLASLARETTEDRIPRGAPLMSKAPSYLFREPSITVLTELKCPEDDAFHGIHHAPVDKRSGIGFHQPPKDSLYDLTDISMSNSTMQAEVPVIGNLTEVESMHEITEPIPPALSFDERNNSVSVICRVDGQKHEPRRTVGTSGSEETAAVLPVVIDVSEDEFYDAEEEAEQGDPLSLTKSRHVTMKFVDVDKLERTNYSRPAVFVPDTASKRLHAEVSSSPVVGRPSEKDPLEMTRVRNQQTPLGPVKKRPRTSGTSSEEPTAEALAKEKQSSPARDDLATEEECITVKQEERQSKAADETRISQTIINDPSVFAIDDEDLIEDESNLSCSLTTGCIESDAGVSKTATRGTSANIPTSAETTLSMPFPSRSLPRMLTDLSYYRNFANMTIDNMDICHEDEVGSKGKQEDDPDPMTDDVQECILVSDDDSLRATPPKCSALKTDRMDEVLSRMRRELKRRQEMCDLVRDRFRTRFESIKRRLPEVDQSGKVIKFEAEMEELNWRLLRAKLEESFFSYDETKRRSRTAISDRYPETPSVMFLAENLRRQLSEQQFIDNGPSPGAPFPEVPSITRLISNKLSTDSGTRWVLDCSDESDGHLLLRHQTLRSFVIWVQLKPPSRNRTDVATEPRGNWRLERIQVRENQQDYVHSPKLLLAHIEFMLQAAETTERTLRSTYRTVSALMGLWQRFDEILRRVFSTVNRLLTIVRNNDALLCYDVQLERFYVKKYFHRSLDNERTESNLLEVHFRGIGAIGRAGVTFKRSVPDVHKLFPVTAMSHVGGGSATDGTSDEKSGLMFLECLFWNLTNQYGME